jgi:hypothetical protein
MIDTTKRLRKNGTLSRAVFLYSAYAKPLASGGLARPA